MWKSITSLCVLLSCALPTYAQTSITPAPDATGTQVTPIGNQYNITGGTQAGSNLFHSFQQLGLNPGEIANFIAQPHIQNILGRVVGGEASLINGLIQVAGGNANLYLMNPAGIIFGPNAQLNVPADFTATTATAIGFGNNTWFNAQGENNYANLIGIPSEFQFPYHNPGTIINEGNLTVNPQQHLTLLGGTTINLGTLEAPGGKITIAAIPGEQVVRISQEGHLLTLDLPLSETPTTSETPIQPPSLPQLITGGFLSHANQMTVNSQGQVELTGSGITLPPSSGLNITSGSLDVSGNQGGEMQILGQQIGVIDANINASGINGGGEIFVGGDIQGQGILPNASRTFISPNSQISADALEAGDGGQIIIFAEETARIYGTLSARGGQHSGNGGFIETSGLQSLDITQTPDTSAPFGEGGTWLIDPYNVDIVAGNGNTNINTSNPFSPTGDTAKLGIDLLRNALKNSSNVEITTGTGGTQQGDITLSTDLDFNDIGNSSLTLNAEGGIFINRPIFDSNLTTPDSLNLTLQAQSRSVTINAPISTQGGDINMTGESDGNGISLTAPLNSGGGAINLTGTSVGLGMVNGVNIEGGIDSGGGDINIEAATGGSVALNVQAPISAGTGNISLISDLPFINNIISGTGDLLIRPQNQNANIFLGPDIPGQFSLSEVELTQQIDISGTVTLENTGTISIAALNLNNSSNPAPARKYTLVLKGETLEFFNTLTLSPNQTGHFIATGNILDSSPVNSAIFDGNILLDAHTIGTAADSLYIKGSQLAAITRSGNLFLDTGDILINPPQNTVSTVSGITGIQSAGQLNIQGSQLLNLDDNLTSNGAMTLAPPLNLVDDITLNSNGGFINLDNTINGNQTLILNSGGATFTSPVGNTTPLNSLTVTGATQLNANITTTDTQTYNNAVQLNDNLTLNSTNNITFGQTLDGAQDLTLNSDSITFSDAVGSIDPLNRLTVNGNTRLNSNVTTTTDQTYTGSVQLDNSVILESGNGNISFVNTVDGAHTLTVNSDNITFADAVGSIDPLNQLTVNGTTALNGDITTTGAQTYNGFVQLNNSVTLDSGGANIAFPNPISGTEDLTVNAGEIIFSDAVGTPNPLTGLTLNGNTTLNGNVITTGAQTYNGSVQVNDNVILESGNGDITFGQTLDGTQDFKVDAGTGNITFNGKVGSTNPLANFTIDSTGLTQINDTVNAGQIRTNAGGTTEINADITTTGEQSYNDAVILGSSVTFSTENSNLTFDNTVDGATAGGENLTVQTGTGDLQFFGAVGNSVPLGDITLVADDMSFEGSLAGTGNLTIEPFTNSQNIRLGGTDNNDSNTLEISSEDIQNWQNGFQSITVGRNTLSGAIVTEGNLTFQDPITMQTGASVTVNGSLTGVDNASIGLEGSQINLNADITTANHDINLNGVIALGADAILSTGAGEGNLNIAGSIDGNFGLTLESGTGEISLNGNLGETNPLNRLNIQGQVTTGGNGLSITTINDVTTGDISTSGQPLSLTSNQGNIQTGDLDTSATGSGGSLTLTSPTGSITTGNLTSAGDTAGGDINVQAQVSITTGDIDSSATTGDGGSVFLDPIGNVQVGFINAQGGTEGTGAMCLLSLRGDFSRLGERL
ncbi:filamentous hemagglutinin N-terminal domain-containing protein [Roseofilum sp. BLCC_M154]|uniref:Filamentous hemagglutinin N-terminal domain-containing protein n=1 Tax=Roseofilum acuticapitatum BLCC-M154 TaxID=3022444 RepID=A0ABT7AP63_9CYAN|nr:filamentous hemagglutinin N-terminal domain-containing protein [Roseofilum acuticapitatum]MDJ1168686.1 filamentous hemagglutinin N-terminal domain-containing protein [Roseofilum acuticapitatum BLCC-M154]